MAWSRWLDIMAIGAWGTLLLKYWFTGKMNVLLHPDYMWLANSAGVCLIALSGFKALQLLVPRCSKGVRLPSMQHFSVFPPGLGSAILLTVAIVGLQFTPRPFSSQVAVNRGVTETLSMTRSQPQAFRASTRPEDKSVIDWVRTLNVYPEPDAYTGQPARVEGFVIQSPELPDGYFMISRFIITCCAADAYPAGLPVKLAEEQPLPNSDTWLRVEGSMTTESYNDSRHLVIQASSLTTIPEPKNPYDY
ncbi:TIGR03943 family protein [Oculatella sp. LEGE 06141]|nr:TIGR03943 family protein [Oculatella sp. LEGE 06141]